MSSPFDPTRDPRIASKGKLTPEVRRAFLTALIHEHPELFAEAGVLNFDNDSYLPRVSPLTRIINASEVYLERDDENTNTVGLVKETIQLMGGTLVGSISRASRFAVAEFLYRGWHLAVWAVVAPDEYMEGALTSRVRVSVLSDH